MFTAMNVPIANKPFHSLFTISRCGSLPSLLRSSTMGASAHIWNIKCMHVKLTGNLNPAMPRVYRFSRFSDEFKPR